VVRSRGRKMIMLRMMMWRRRKIMMLRMMILGRMADPKTADNTLCKPA
jgi:hypothetical protein